MKVATVSLALTDGRVMILEGTNWDRFTKDLNDDKAYIEQNTLEPDGSGDTFLIMKNQIVLAELIYREK